MIDITFFIKIFTAIIFAFWFNKEIPKFATRINQQIYTEYHSLFSSDLNYLSFEKQSKLKSKKSKISLLFYFIFPVISTTNNSIISIILITLCFLSVIDIMYYLTDIRYIVIIFLLTLYNGNLDTFYFTIFFFISIHLVSYLILKKEGLGLGDSLLFLALSPLFMIEEILLLILLSTILGIIYYLIEPLFTDKKREKLPFIPFISFATLIIIYLI